ncbi:MAG: hypothetical protein GF417_02660, partial [Candidatus Latescibacteria bacterium]|nr:hypothetical protein [bacterium]MBD3423331.1 hypothetical protein [Candidatus Latescibacterota bacterium]
MKTGLHKLAAAVIFLAIPAENTLSIPYTLWKIQKKIERTEYLSAEEDLEDLIPGLKGEKLLWGKLLSARLETDSRRAEDIYRDIISSETEISYIARLELAKIHYASDDYRETIRLLEVVPSREDSKVRLESLFFRGLSHKMLGEVYLAREDFKLIDRGNYLYPAYMELAELDMQTGDYSSAVKRYEAIGGIHSNPVAIFKLGVCYEIIGENSKAFRAY